eukprot:857876_1
MLDAVQTWLLLVYLKNSESLAEHANVNLWMPHARQTAPIHMIVDNRNISEHLSDESPILHVIHITCDVYGKRAMFTRASKERMMFIRQKGDMYTAKGRRLFYHWF